MATKKKTNSTKTKPANKEAPKTAEQKAEAKDKPSTLGHGGTRKRNSFLMSNRGR